MARITINGITIDPMKQAQALAAAHLISADASQLDFILVQVTTPLTPAQCQQLADIGAEILEYISENTCICRYLSAGSLCKTMSPPGPRRSRCAPSALSRRKHTH